MSEALYPLLLLACPVAMGLMMWLMVRRGHHDNGAGLSTAEVTALREELRNLQAKQEERSTELPRS
jgi:hypothetical protein